METEIDQQEEASFNNSETNGIDHCFIYLFICLLIYSVRRFIGPLKPFLKGVAYSFFKSV